MPEGAVRIPGERVHGDELKFDTQVDGVEDLAVDEMRNRAEELQFGDCRFADLRRSGAPDRPELLVTGIEMIGPVHHDTTVAGLVVAENRNAFSGNAAARGSRGSRGSRGTTERHRRGGGGGQRRSACRRAT
ncbi:hypothetical protein ACIQZO_30500 [Streptomyces sp. NPDC097617]|uniref:hypothetical protein n=1 Tax=Streptomyces sp. NPDC097617 TaxID=3366091 RepID=UPI003828DA97